MGLGRLCLPRLDPLLDHPHHAGLLSGFCSSGLNSRHGLPSDSASRPTPLLRRTVPLITARRGLAPPRHTTCVAHNRVGGGLRPPSSHTTGRTHRIRRFLSTI